VGSRRTFFARRSSAVLVVIAAVFSVAVLVFGYWFYGNQRAQVERQVEQELTAVAVLKADQISRWRGERLSEGGLLGTSQPFIAAVARWRAQGAAEDAEFIRGRLRAFDARPEYDSAVFVDRDGIVHFAEDPIDELLHPAAREAMAVAERNGIPVLTDLHVVTGDPNPHIDVVVPIVTSSGGEAEFLGAVLLKCDADEFLYPLIQSWPIPSETGESLLVRRDGSDVLFLNELRHVEDAALTKRLPLTLVETPAVRAVLGDVGMVTGEDYRGVPVVAALTAIPDSPWRLVVKVDEAEAFAEWHGERLLLILLGGGLVIATAAGIAIIWQRDHLSQVETVLAAERSRRESEESHGATLMSVGDGVIVTDAACRVTLINPVAEELTGWPAAEAVGRPLEEVFNIINEYTREVVENPAREVMRNGAIVGLANHTLLIARDGTERPIADSGAPVRVDDGEVSGVVLVFRDQTEERAARVRLQLQRDRLEAAERHAGLGSWEYEAGSGITWWSPQAYHLFGLDALSGPPDADALLSFVHPEDRASLSRAFADMECGRVPRDGEYRTDPARGPVRTLVTKTRVVVDENGALAGYAGTLMDVTERAAYERDIQESRQMLRLVLDTVPARVFWKDLDLNYLGCNDAFARDAGFVSPDEITGKSDFDLSWKDSAEQYRADDRAIIESGAPRLANEVPQVTADGRAIWLSLSKIPLRDAQGAIIGVMGTYEDVTALRRARERLDRVNRELEAIVAERTRELQEANEELQCSAEELEHINERLVEAAQAKSRFLRAMSHELRTPLNSIIGFSGVMLKGLAGTVTSEQRRQLEMIDTAGRHLLALINDILDLSRIEAGKVEVVLEPVDVASLAHAVVDSVNAAAEAKGLRLELSVPDEPVALVSDERKIRQILINLLGNALKFTDEGSVALSVNASAAHTVAFSVIDTGPGVAPEDQQRIFGEFVQAFDREDRVREGTGLGLAISQSLATALGGSISVASDGRSGSTFTLFLPSKPSEV